MADSERQANHSLSTDRPLYHRPMPTLALLDGHSLAYRAFYALPEDLATESGQVTNAVYGFTSMLIKLLDDHAPDGLVVAWDVGRATFRTQEYPEYKAQRAASPDNFNSQVPLIKKVAETLQIPQFAKEGFEADDLIATLARHAAGAGWDVLVVTGDRDSFQLVDETIKVVYTRRGISDIVVADEAWITDKYGIRPDQYNEYAALRGDNSDNLPGVPGVGEKTAARLIAGYGTLESIYEHLDEQTPKLRDNLAVSRDQVFLNRRLMRLVDDVELDIDLEDFHRTVPDRQATKDLFDSLEFHSLWQRLVDLDGGVAASEVEEIDVEIRSLSADSEIEALSGSGLVVEPVRDGGRLVGLMVVLTDQEAAFVPADRLEPLRAALADPTVAIAADHAKDLISDLFDLGYEVSGLVFDPALANYVIDPASRSHALEDVAERILSIELSSADEDDDERSQGTLDFGGGPDLDLAARRAVATARLREPLETLMDERGVRILYDDFEIPLVGVLARMERAGILVDREYLVDLGASLRDQLALLEAEIHSAAGEPFNVNSTLQLRKVLFEDLGLPVLKKTTKGAPSTDASVLSKLADAHPIVGSLLKYRELEKLRGTYVDGYLPLIEHDGRIHATFNQIAAATGRLSSDHPNMQTIPVRSETGRTIRRAFVAEPTWTFVVADYSQIELRILAHLSQDPGLLEAFGGDETDVHTATAARVFGFEPELVTTEMRRRAKVINFGLLYGMEAFGLAERLEISREEAQEHMDQYFEQFPNVREFMRTIVSDARKDGYTTTIFGRRRYLPELKSDNFRIRQMGERMALNAPVQGSAADIIKLAMIRLDQELAGLKTTMLLQVHDELVLEAPREELEEAKRLTVQIMEGVADLSVPLRVDLVTATNLADAKA